MRKSSMILFNLIDCHYVFFSCICVFVTCSRNILTDGLLYHLTLLGSFVMSVFVLGFFLCLNSVLKGSKQSVLSACGPGSGLQHTPSL